MLPPVLEIFVVWHPDDEDGPDVARQLIDHFHGTAFSGLIGGAVEVYVRSAGWRERSDTPRPLPFMKDYPPGVAPPSLAAVVLVLGRELGRAVQRSGNPWYDYVSAIARAHRESSEAVRVFPLSVSSGVLTQTRLGELVGKLQEFGRPSQGMDEPPEELRSRDLAQALAQFAGPPGELIRVFVSHTKRSGPDDAVRVAGWIERIRHLIGKTRLQEFFDASDLQPGEDWSKALIDSASRSALLALRTDLYASRQWCQSEMRLAKTAGMPVVILDALATGEERGSFLMDHVPRVAGGAEPEDRAVMRALNQLVDECLKRALWKRQSALAGDEDLAVTWWAPHAPEPVTLASWLVRKGELPPEGPIRVLHPDPPLGRDERDVLEDIARLAGFGGRLEIMTPRGLAARGG